VWELKRSLKLFPTPIPQAQSAAHDAVQETRLRSFKVAVPAQE
jgi:hypothetical protein